MNKALDAMPSDYHLARINTSNSLGSLYHMLCKQTNSLDDFDQAVNFIDEAANAMPHDHPDRTSFLLGLVRMLVMRAAIMESQDDAKRMLESFIVSRPNNTWSHQQASERVYYVPNDQPEGSDHCTTSDHSCAHQHHPSDHYSNHHYNHNHAQTDWIYKFTSLHLFK
ncbi:uncharacterized protein TrAtP1_000562 [Trichoderma atroviride]|uniref:uncharacterized protein n=1 Tax=Hypocrea atroviridis TaxID=63577 RepID=UPI00332B2AC4|nr:hypothetical protein TrAtP1_000562 [Trichoderma atroviride]